MKKYIKTTAFLTGLMIMGWVAHAEVPLFNFRLEVQNVSDPQIFVGKDKKFIPANGPNTFTVNARKSDYIFLVQYEHNGQTQEATCPISGAPTAVTAVIDPTKTGSAACTTQELSRV